MDWLLPTSIVLLAANSVLSIIALLAAWHHKTALFDQWSNLGTEACVLHATKLGTVMALVVMCITLNVVCIATSDGSYATSLMIKARRVLVYLCCSCAEAGWVCDLTRITDRPRMGRAALATILAMGVLSCALVGSARVPVAVFRYVPPSINTTIAVGLILWSCEVLTRDQLRGPPRMTLFGAFAIKGLHVVPLWAWSFIPEDHGAVPVLQATGVAILCLPSRYWPWLIHWRRRKPVEKVDNRAEILTSIGSVDKKCDTNEAVEV